MGGDPHPFYVPPSGFLAERIVLFPEEEARHILRVVRLRSGDECRVVDGKGGLFRVRLTAQEERLEGTILEQRRERAGRPALELAFPILRSRARADWLVEKAVEVGVDALVPLRWSRSVRPLTEAVRSRWERIAREAMKQSERCWLPQLRAPERPGDSAVDRRLVLADPEGEEAVPDPEGFATVRLLVGPEGGVDPQERDRLIEQGAHLWSLGPTRLRAETAAVVGSHRLACALQAVRRGEIERKGG